MKPDIRGLLTDLDKDVLYNAGLHSIGPILEIGSYHGASTVLLAQGLIDNEHNTYTLITVDPFNKHVECGIPGLGIIVHITGRITRWIRDRNLDKYCVRHKVWTLNDRSCDIINTFPDNIFGTIFIDGDHSYPATKVDLMQCIPKLKSGGLLLVHDKNHKDVIRAVHEEVTGDIFMSYAYYPGCDMACIAYKE